MDRNLKKAAFAFMYGFDPGLVSIEKSGDFVGAYNKRDVEATYYSVRAELDGYRYREGTPVKFVDEAALAADQQLAYALQEKRATELLNKKMAIVASYGDDTFANGTILNFSKQFDENGKSYEYAVLKTNDQWFATGRIGAFTRGTWDNFVLALVSGNFPVIPEEITICDRLVPMIDSEALPYPPTEENKTDIHFDASRNHTLVEGISTAEGDPMWDTNS